MADGARYGLIADVHSNLQALEAALAWIDERSVDAVYCLGDVVGYGGDPAACLEIVRERCAGTVRGNHDAAVVDASLRDWFNPHARKAIERQAELLDEEARAWLAELPYTLDLGPVAIAHSGFADPEAFEYVTTDRDARRELGAAKARWNFLAHTHVPAAWRRTADGEIEELILPERDAASLDHEGAYLINPGSVGQPRDGDPRAACAVFDVSSATYRSARLDYDVAAAQSAIHRSGMPGFEAERLARGR